MQLTNLRPLNSRSNWNLAMLAFEEGALEKPENQKKATEQGQELTTNSTTIGC